MCFCIFVALLCPVPTITNNKRRKSRILFSNRLFEHFRGASVGLLPVGQKEAPQKTLTNPRVENLRLCFDSAQHARKRSAAEMLGGDEDKRISEPSVENKDSKEIQDELTDEEIFYSTYIQKSDDMWEALDEEVKEIEKFFLNKKTK